MALSLSASAPQLARTGSGSSATLRASAGAMGLTSSGSAATLANATTTLYDKMTAEGLFRDYVAPKVRASGRSITVPLADSVERDLQPEVHFALPATPAKERKFRRLSEGPGEITVHHGLKDQKLPGNEFRYGVRGSKGTTVEEAMKAGQLLGVAEYKNSCNEQVYESTRREPLGKPQNRGHTLKMLPEGFGSPSSAPEDGKEVIYHKHLKPDTEENRLMYKKTHNNYAPGERLERNYNWPAEAQDKNFKFGAGLAAAVEGAGARIAFNLDVDEDGNYKRTKLVTKVCEDYRHVQHPKLMKKTHPKQGATGPPMQSDHRYGVKSSISEYTAQSCIKGYYSLEEQLPDMDLGRCTKPGRRNVTIETRAFGTPSIRTDKNAPHPSRRSVADECSYGDEPSAASILCPQRFDSMGIPDREFLIRRSRDDLEELMKNVPLDHVNFDELWEQSLALFDDGLPLVSLDAMLYVHSGKIEHHVAASCKGLHLTVPAS
mmetsp:Transcript_47185/g.119419  ORF Transcript_47185/g.119419 Transcript_47185/m.119419 type:complete len:490 (+) Transcript_47185:76-1545(+)|eukprot:CAMPEP_0183405514 /NCGR_PEP_ID=MMETSP0370-20130417/15886_1 /TAXON_ID=268820 /ORGANISM="Peridinium aciculiferum, Strain PAER-2" /LENGTH=489 /DNA_ID=CAMNT_0025587509 /DNA_START=79 /DNA_END=1548 /DNA_ORIENTATION=-